MGIIDRIFGQVKEQAAPEAPAQPRTLTEQSETSFLRRVAIDAERELEAVRNAPAPKPVVLEDPNSERDYLSRITRQALGASARDQRARQQAAASMKKAQERQNRAALAEMVRNGHVGRDEDFVTYEQADPAKV